MYQRPLSYAPMDIPRTPAKRTGRYLVYLVAVVAAAGGLVGLRRLRPAVPAVDHGSLWMDVVKRGPLVREVQGQGTLVPEEIRWITAKGSGRVERVLGQPGAMVKPDTVILELANPDVQLQALEAGRQLAQARAELASLQASLNAQRLAQESVIATIGSDLADARRRASASNAMAKKGYVPDLEQAQAVDRANELSGRLDFEKRRLGAHSQGIVAQVTAQRVQIERLRAIAEFRLSQVRDLTVRAGVTGVLQELPLHEGQAVAAGALMAKVVRPDRLKAEIRIPETQAKDIQVGQKASVDTRNALVHGHVARIDPAAQAGTVRVDVTLDELLPPGARPDLNVEGTVEIERLSNVLFVGRPAVDQPGSMVALFKLDPDGGGAQRTTVRLGRSSVKSVEVVAGLREGDRVVLSDMSEWDHTDRIRLK